MIIELGLIEVELRIFGLNAAALFKSRNPFRKIHVENNHGIIDIEILLTEHFGTEVTRKFRMFISPSFYGLRIRTLFDLTIKDYDADKDTILSDIIHAISDTLSPYLSKFMADINSLSNASKSLTNKSLRYSIIDFFNHYKHDNHSVTIYTENRIHPFSHLKYDSIIIHSIEGKHLVSFHLPLESKEFIPSLWDKFLYLFDSYPDSIPTNILIERNKSLRKLTNSNKLEIYEFNNLNDYGEVIVNTLKQLNKL